MLTEGRGVRGLRAGPTSPASWSLGSRTEWGPSASSAHASKVLGQVLAAINCAFLSLPWGWGKTAASPF